MRSERLVSEMAGSRQSRHRLCLEFANTVSWHASNHPEEGLKTYKDLVTWMQKAHYLSDREARALLKHAAERPTEARHVLRQAIVLREAIYHIFVALVRNEVLAKTDLGELNNVLVKLTRGARVVHSAQGFMWNWNANANNEGLNFLIWPIAISAAKLLISEESARVGQCADEQGCGWLFLDTSKNRSRRWCDATDCGNRARQRRHNERIRKYA